MEYKDKINIHKHRNFGEIINVTFDFIQQNGRSILKAFLSFALPLLVLGFGIIMYSIINSNPAIIFLGFFIFISGMSLFNFSIYVLIKNYNDATSPNAISVKNIWKSLTPRLGPFIGTTIVAGIIVGTASLFFYIPGLVLYTYLSFVLPVIIFEKGTVGSAISRSFSLIQGHFWFTVGLSLVLNGIELLFSYLITGPFIIALMFGLYNDASFLNFENDNYLAYSLVTLGSFIQYATYTLIWIITAVAYSFYYFSIREDREHIGMINEINLLGTHTEDDDFDY